MTIEVKARPPISMTARPKSPGLPRSIASWPAWLGLAIMALPTFARLSQEVWSTESGAHGPIVLFTGLWLVRHIHRLSDIPSAKPNWMLVTIAMLVAFALYAFGRAYDFISIEAGAVYLAMLAVTYRTVGAPAMRVLAFPLFYLAFLVPPPGWIIDQVTAPLQEFISLVATETLSFFGYPIMRSGVALFIAQYQLLVEEACSGMNSIVGLIAISLFYIYMMHRASWRYAAVLLALVLPIAIAANLIRVMVLVLITYHWGDAAAQGFLHVSAGMVLFTIALGLIFGIDTLLQRVLRHKRVVAS